MMEKKTCPPRQRATLSSRSDEPSSPPPGWWSLETSRIFRNYSLAGVALIVLAWYLMATVGWVGKC